MRYHPDPTRPLPHSIFAWCHVTLIILDACYLAGASLLPSARSYAEAALQSPHHRLRRLGCEQLGRLLLVTADEQQQRQLESTLVGALQVRVTDADTAHMFPAQEIPSMLIAAARVIWLASIT
jgi:hypothetical protein